MNSEDWKKFVAHMRKQCVPRLTLRETELFCEVEAVLHLYQTLQPRAGERNAAEAWALLSGYAIPELNASESDLQKCLKLRCNLRYVRTASAWTWWLKWICVSGAGIRREINLRQIVRELAKDSPHTPSDLQRELDHWQGKETPRRILLVVGSYEQAGWTLNELNDLPKWRGRALRLLPDDTELLDEHTLRTREVEYLRSHDADVLIAPLLAIQRGFNILDEAKEALLGSVFFLVRPYPPPDDMTPQILSLNAWTIGQLDGAGRRLCPEFSGVTGLRQLRRLTHREWHKRLSAGRRGLKSMSDSQYDEFLRNQFVVVWQTIGRLLRGARDARVFFVDGAFSTPHGTRHMLLDWHSMLNSLIREGGDSQRHTADRLYRPIREAFQRAVDTKDIY